MISWLEEILDGFAEYFDVCTQSEFKTAKKSKPGNEGLSVYVQREREGQQARGQRASSDCETQPLSPVCPQAWERCVWTHNLFATEDSSL